MDGSVAAQNKNEIGAIADRLRREFRRVTRVLGRNNARPKVRAAKCVSGTL